MRSLTLAVILAAGLITLPLLAAPTAALAAGENIRFISAAEVEVEVVNPQGVKVLERKPAELVVPGTVVIYTNAFTNVGKEPAERLVVTNPVPNGTEYLGGSASEEESIVTFSVDGGQNFAAPAALTVPDGQGGQRRAEPRDYTHIRWQRQAPLAPGAGDQVEFRARLK